VSDKRRGLWSIVRINAGAFIRWFTVWAAGLACYLLLCAYGRKNSCHTQLLRFFVGAIHYQFVKIVLLTCSHRDIYGACLAYYGLLPEVSPVYRILNHPVDDDDWWRSWTSSRRYAQKMSNICLRAAYWTTVDNSRHYKNNLLTDEKVLRLSATFKLSFRTIFCQTNRTVSCLHLRWLTCVVEYCDCGQCGCGTSRNGRGLLPIGDNSYGPRPSYIQL